MLILIIDTTNDTNKYSGIPTPDDNYFSPLYMHLKWYKKDEEGLEPFTL